MCPRDGTPLFAAESSSEPAASTPQHKVGSLEEASDAIEGWSREASVEDIEPLPSSPPVLSDADETNELDNGGFRVVGGGDGAGGEDPTSVMQVDDREAFERRALEAAGAIMGSDDEDLPDAGPATVLDPRDEGPPTAVAPQAPAATGAGARSTMFGFPGTDASQEPPQPPPAAPAAQPRGQMFNPPETVGEAPMPSFLGDEESLPEPIFDESDPFARTPYASQQQPQQPQYAAPSAQRPLGQQQPDGPQPLSTAPNAVAAPPAQLEEVPSSNTAEVILPDGLHEKKSSTGKTIGFLVLAVLLGAAVGAGAYFAGLVPAGLLGEKTVEEQPQSDPPAVVAQDPDPPSEPDLVVAEADIGMVIDIDAEDAGAADAGPSEEEIATTEAASLELAAAILNTGESVGTQIEEALAEAEAEERQRKRRRKPKRRKRAPEKKEEPESSDQTSISVWGGGSSAKKEEPKNEEPKNEEKKDESLDIW